jgi:transposase
MVDAMLFLARTGGQWRYFARALRGVDRGVAPVAALAGLWPLYKIEHVFAQLGRWRRLSRCYEGSEASARAWLEVASVGYLAWRTAV